MVQSKKTKKITLNNTNKKTAKSKTSKDLLHSLKVSVRIGKNGLNEGTIYEVNRFLTKNKTIKVKFLNSTINKDNKDKLMDTLATKTNSKILKKVGFVVILSREKTKKTKSNLKTNIKSKTKK